jgi:hypothetical protein
MGSLTLATVEVFHLMRDGQPVAFALSEAALRDEVPKNDQRVQLVRKSESAGVVTGEVLDWSKHGGHPFNPKLHWTCPRCGQQWWEDFVGDVANPYFAGSGCPCVNWWLVHWEASQAAGELTSRSS